jgi:hypothetical protein
VNDHEQRCSEAGTAAGTASIEKKKASPPRDSKYMMATGVVAANDHQQMTSEGGNARSNNNQQRLKGEDQEVYEVGYSREGLLR